MEDKRDVYMVYREGGGMPAKVHYSHDEAVEEAERLAKLPASVRSHAAFYIMQAVQTVKAVQPEVIEVGDEIKLTEDFGVIQAGTICDVVQVFPDGGVKARPRHWIFPSTGFTLISKGNVHVFEGVYYSNPDGSQYPIAYQESGRVMKSIVDRGLVNDGNTYTMTLKREVSDGA